MLESREMVTETDPLTDLRALNDISVVLNRSHDVQTALDTSLSMLINLMGLETGWVFVADEGANERWGGRGFRLAAHHNLPPALAVTNPEAWDKSCDCQALCLQGKMTGAFNEVHCSRLGSAWGDKDGLAVHASTPLRSGDRVLGILNVAAPDWSHFTPRSLSLLTNVGNQIGIALERARLFDAIQEQRIHEQAALLDLSQQLLSRRDLDDLLKFIVEEVREQVQADASAVLLTGPDPDFLYFRAASGWLHDPVSEGRRAPANEETGSGRVMRTQQVLQMEDLRLSQPPLWSSDWLDSEGFRAAVMVPLLADGRSIGTLVIDYRQPRVFTEGEIRFLRLMANQVALALEKARLHNEEVQRERMDEELTVARQIQMSMLPVAPPQLPGWQYATYFKAAHQVGGDFYDYFPLPGEPGRWGIAIADVSDKGVPAAIFMAMSRTTIRNIALRGRSPAEVLSWANRYIQEDSQSDMFLSAFYAELNMNTGQLIYANAGHNPPLLWRTEEKEFYRLPATSPLLGVLANLDVSATSIDLRAGDILILYTDGISEALNMDYEEFGMTRLKDVIRDSIERTSNPTADDIQTAIADAVRTFTDNMMQYDDITLLIVKRDEVADGSQ